MFSENSELYIAIVIISLIFLIICLSLIFIVVLYNQKRRSYVEEKKEMGQKFESEILKTHLEVQEQTMQTIANDLHDNIGQLLSLTTLTLGSINIDDQKKAEKKIADSLTLVNNSIQELRDIAKLLQGEQIVETGIGKAIKQELDRLKRIGGYKLKVKNQLVDLAFSSPNKDLIILRLFQEIINNIIKHAQASSIEIDVHLISDTLCLLIKDNGIGFNYKKVDKEGHGMGLRSIHKRVEMIKGQLSIESINEKGTIIAIHIPYP